MKNAIVLEQADIKKIIAEKFGVPEKSVIKSQYSFTVMMSEDDEDEEES